MYHVRNSCEINIILNQSMHDRDVSIFHEFSANSLLKISDYYYGNTVNRCSGICYGCFCCTIIKHINTLLRVCNLVCRKSGSSFLQTECDCQFCFTSTLHPKLVLSDHRNHPIPYKNHTTERLLKIYNKYVRGNCMFCSGTVEKHSSYDE